jgi:hypothetical protein
MTSFKSSRQMRLGFRALRFGQPVDLDLELARCLVEADISCRVVAAFAIVEPSMAAVRVLRLELEARRQHLLHQQAGRDRLQRVVDGLGDGSSEASGSAIRLVNRARSCPARRGSRGR